MKAGFWVGAGALSGFLAVAFGAFGAHALAARLSEKALSVYHTGAQYQFYHAFALIAVGLWIAQSGSTQAGQAAGWCFLVGSILFSGSLYALALSDIRLLGAITPLGGLCFLAGWLLLAWAALRP
jgi:uncharacterized membrane protein YgdD (TMEM256/DUF423 family)